jgi:hypothetical protein
VLRRIFVPKGDEVTGGWGKLQIEKVHNFYSSPNIIMTIKSRETMGGACSTHGTDAKFV